MVAQNGVAKVVWWGEKGAKVCESGVVFGRSDAKLGLFWPNCPTCDPKPLNRPHTHDSMRLTPTFCPIHLYQTDLGYFILFDLIKRV